MRGRTAWGLCLLLVMPAGVAGCRPAGSEGGSAPAEHDEAGEHADGSEHDDGDGTLELTAAAEARIGLTVVPAAVRDLESSRTTTGQVGFDEDRLAHVGSRVAGRLTRVPAQLGARVAAGEPLAVVDSVELGEARAAYLRARARAEVTGQRLERQRSLLAERIVPELEVLDAEAAAREATADREAARASLLLLGVAPQEVDALSWPDAGASTFTIEAPFAGRVVAREATLGELVTPEDDLFTIADLSRVWLWADLYERDLAHVRVGDPVEVRLDAWPGTVVRGELVYLADVLDPETRTLRARIDLPNPEARLRPGMFARVTLLSAGAGVARALAVPRSAVQRDGGATVVFVRTGPGRFERRTVEIGRSGGEWAEVVSGLAAGEEVVDEGAFLLLSQARADELGGHHH